MEFVNPPYSGNIVFGADAARDEGGESMVTTKKTRADVYSKMFANLRTSEKKQKATEKAKSSLKSRDDAINGVIPTAAETMAGLIGITPTNKGGGYVTGSPTVYYHREKNEPRTKSKPIPDKKETFTEYKLKVKLNEIIEQNNKRKKKITEQNKTIKALRLEIEQLKKTGTFPLIIPNSNKNGVSDRFSQIDI